jgi:flagellar biogenesis protein FliO
MRSVLALACLAGATLASAAEETAKGAFGTKSSGGAGTTAAMSNGGPSIFSILQMIIAVAIVVGLMKYVLPKVVSKMGGKLTTTLNGGIRIEESATFPGGNLYVVTVSDRKLLLGATAQSISTLADLGPVVKPNPGPAFLDYLDTADISKVTPAAEAVPTRAVVAVEAPLPVEEEKESDPREALERLARLMG